MVVPAWLGDNSSESIYIYILSIYLFFDWIRQNQLICLYKKRMTQFLELPVELKFLTVGTGTSLWHL